MNCSTDRNRRQLGKETYSRYQAHQLTLQGSLLFWTELPCIAIGTETAPYRLFWRRYMAANELQELVDFLKSPRKEVSILSIPQNVHTGGRSSIPATIDSHHVLSRFRRRQWMLSRA
jgi:hypothetical protein